MLVSKIKPCMSKDKFFYGKPANGSLNQLKSTELMLIWITVVILELIHVTRNFYGYDRGGNKEVPNGELPLIF